MENFLTYNHSITRPRMHDIILDDRLHHLQAELPGLQFCGLEACVLR
jgi:hypothetical protein